MAEDDFYKQNTQPGFVEQNQPITNPEVPKTIGPYKIESLLERGGMSVLYLGTHPETKEPTTIKVLLPRFLSNPDIVQRFLREAEIIALADHPNIVKLYGHGEWEGGLYIAIEFIEGISLRQALLQSPMSLKRALEIVIDIAYALCHLHTHGVIHRDLKPENILITDQDKIKVIDFGIAQLLTETTSAGTEQKQRVIGTPIYMSPEQRENPEKVFYPSDIYSLGIITYELVLGKLSHGQIHLSLMPKGLQKILNKALQPKPEDRYQDIVDFIADVTEYLNSTNLEKEKKGADQLSEFSEDLKLAQSILFNPKMPEWKNTDIGIATHKGNQIYCVYQDFFCPNNEELCILCGEAVAKKATGMVYTSMLSGAIKLLSKQALKAEDFIQSLHDFLIKSEIDQIFTLSYLALNPKKNVFTYISCGYGNLWQIKKNQNAPTKITTNNLALGIEPNMELVFAKDSWEVGDYLLINTNASLLMSANEFDFSEEIFRQIIIENRHFPHQRAVDNMMRRIKVSANKFLSDHTLTLINLYRKE